MKIKDIALTYYEIEMRVRECLRKSEVKMAKGFLYQGSDYLLGPSLSEKHPVVKRLYIDVFDGFDSLEGEIRRVDRVIA
jgi:hypothetical protein